MIQECVLFIYNTNQYQNWLNKGSFGIFLSTNYMFCLPISSIMLLIIRVAAAVVAGVICGCFEKSTRRTTDDKRD